MRGGGLGVAKEEPAKSVIDRRDSSRNRTHDQRTARSGFGRGSYCRESCAISSRATFLGEGPTKAGHDGEESGQRRNGSHT
jgi:hypothetical protein